MGLDRTLCHEQFSCDLLVCLTCSDERKDLEFALAQRLREPRTQRGEVRAFLFQCCAQLPEVVCRDAVGRVQLASLLHFEHFRYEDSHLWALVDEAPDVALRFAQRQGFCQGVHSSLFLSLCPQGQCLERQDLYLSADPSRGLGRLTKVG